MKVLKVYSSEFEVRMVVGRLEAEGITAVVSGAREYASVVVGGPGQGRYELKVPEADVVRAAEILADIAAEVKKPEPAPSQNEPRPKSHYLKRAVMFAAAGIMIPLIFNYFSLRHAAHYANLETNTVKKFSWLAVIAVLNVASLWVEVWSWDILLRKATL